MHTLARRTSLALLTVILMGASNSVARPADPPDSLATELTALSGTGLMRAECHNRMQRLVSMLGKAGYGSMRSHLGEDGSMIARWYNPQSHTTVLAFAGVQATDNAFLTTEMTGLVRWNELQ